MPDEGIGDEVMAALVELQRCVNRSAGRARLQGDAGEGVTAVEIQLLRTIVGLGSTRVSDLAVQQGVDKSTITPQVRRLGVRGLVGRAEDPADHRSVLLTATPEGCAVLAAIDRNGAAFLDRALADWTPEERTTFGTLFSRFAKDVQAAI